MTNTSATHTLVTDSNGSELGWAFGPLARSGGFSLSTPNGLDLLARAADLDEAREALEAHRTWVATRFQ